MSKEVVKLFKEYSSRSERFEELRKDAHVFTFEEIRQSSEVCWFKDCQQRMVVISRGYAKFFKVAQAEYEGNLDKNIHGDLGIQYTEIDELVYLNQSSLRFKARWDRDEVIYEGVVFKTYDQLQLSSKVIDGTYGEIRLSSEDVYRGKQTKNRRLS